MADGQGSDQFVDVLSPLGRQVLRLNAASAYERLVVHGDGGADEARALLKGAKPENLLSVPVKSVDDANALVSGLWLWHDFLDESHVISQSIPSATGSFWHESLH